VIYLLAAGAGLAAAVVGWLVTGAAAAWIADLFGMSDFEGARGMFAFLGVGPIGGLAAMVTAVWLVVRRGRGQAPVGATVGRVGAVLGGIVVLVAAAIGMRLLTLDTYSNEAPPALEFEIRLPATLALTDRDAVRVELHTDRNVGDGTLFAPWPRVDGAYQLLAGSVPLAFKTSGRLLVLELPGEPTRLFRLPLARNPSSTPGLGEWRRADHVHAAGAGQPVAAPADDPVALRLSRPARRRGVSHPANGFGIAGP